MRFKISEFFKGADGMFSMSRLLNFVCMLGGLYGVVRLSLGSWCPSWPAVVVFVAFLAYGMGPHIFGKFLAAAKSLKEDK